MAFVKYACLVALAAASLSATAHATNIIDQNSPTSNADMANFNQPDLAQSFKQAHGNISGAGAFLYPGVGSGPATITISLWTALPNATGAVKLASGSVNETSNNLYADVFWSPVSVAANMTYYLVFESTNNTYGITGDTGNPYANGQVYANSGYQSFPAFDYTFRTFYSDAVTQVPEPASWAVLLLGVTGVGVLARRRRTS